MNYINLAAQLGIMGTIAGKEMRARCPLHDDRTPSWSMAINQGVWKCHRGCGEGDFYKLVELVLRCSQGEASTWIESNGRASSVEQLSRAFAIAMETPMGNPVQSNQNWKERYEVLTNQIMPLWFLERGFTWDTVNQWGIRYDPVMDSVVVPVYQDEQLVGTVTRNTKGYLPKYQNSDNFPRAEILFGKINPNVKRIYLVEGLLDSIYCWQNNLNTAALLGSSISSKQIELLRKHRFGNIVLALDNDEAGRKATKETLKKLQNAGWLLPQLGQVRWPEGIKDANDCDPELLKQVFEETVTVNGFAGI